MGSTPTRGSLGCPSVTTTTLPPFVNSATTGQYRLTKQGMHACVLETRLLAPASSLPRGPWTASVAVCGACVRVAHRCARTLHTRGLRDADGVAWCGSRDLPAPGPLPDRPEGQSSQPVPAAPSDRGRVWVNGHGFKPETGTCPLSERMLCSLRGPGRSVGRAVAGERLWASCPQRGPRGHSSLVQKDPKNAPSLF